MKQGSKQLWQVWLDTGGTFTDGLGISPGGTLQRCKVLSSGALRGTVVRQLDAKRLQISEKWSAPENFIRGFRFRILEVRHPERVVEHYDAGRQIITLNKPLSLTSRELTTFEVQSPDEAPVLAARLLTQTPAEKALPPLHMRLATTRGTNALLERKGAPVLLCITAGFADLLRIGTQQRPDIFALKIVKPQPLYEQVVEVAERLDAQGKVILPMDLDALEKKLQKPPLNRLKIAACVLMHSYLNASHEQALKKRLCELGFAHVSCSSDIAPFINLLARAETTVVDAYLTPLIARYLDGVKTALSGGSVHVMTSAGGLVSANEFLAKDSLLSGPAGGVVGAALRGQRSGHRKIIAFDMGGTSTDVARFDGDYEYVFEHRVGDAHLVGSALAIESVAAGGGSVCYYDGYRLRVGPQSAGASPGPACYGAGGPLTLTDVNLLLGRLDALRFQIPIVRHHAESAFREVLRQVEKKSNVPAAEILLGGFLDIANERMADAIRKISLRKGIDVTEYTLVSFGGAGGQHACAVAALLDMQTALVPTDASLLSAYGLGHAVVERIAQKQVLQLLPDVQHHLPQFFTALQAEAAAALAAEGVQKQEIVVRRRILNARFHGQDSVLTLEYESAESVARAFEEKYQEVFGHLPTGRDIEVESLRVVCSTRPPRSRQSVRKIHRQKAKAAGQKETFTGASWQKIPFFERDRLQPGDFHSGPALVFENHSTTYVEESWSFYVDTNRALVLERHPEAETPADKTVTKQRQA